ncbi:Uncharacterised protein [Salmonella enterica subsp. enterica serovar Typhimurium str. DT104]|nr:Uncharacterised protein [Salmonella enterica subsp. enterica serovar Typhimurium str. DT104]
MGGSSGTLQFTDINICGATDTQFSRLHPQQLGTGYHCHCLPGKRSATDHLGQYSCRVVLRDAISGERLRHFIKLACGFSGVTSGQNKLFIELLTFFRPLIVRLTQSVNRRSHTANQPAEHHALRRHQLLNPPGPVGQRDTGTAKGAKISPCQFTNQYAYLAARHC